MRNFVVAALISTSALAASAQTMGPSYGPICPGPGPVYIKPTPACGATILQAGFFKPGRFQRIYQSTAAGCVPRATVSLGHQKSGSGSSSGSIGLASGAVVQGPFGFGFRIQFVRFR